MKTGAPLSQGSVVAVLFLLCLGGFVCLAALFDLALATTYDVLPQVCAVLVVLSAPALALIVAWRRRWMFVCYALALTVVLTVVAFPWHPRKRFVWDLYTVKAGMTVDEVEAVMGQYIKGIGYKWPVSDAVAYPLGEDRARATGTMTYRWNASD